MEKSPDPEELEILYHEAHPNYKKALWILFILASLYLLIVFLGGMR